MLRTKQVRHTKEKTAITIFCLVCFCFLFFCSYGMQVINIPGIPSVGLYGVLFSSARKSPMRTYSRTNKEVARPPEPLLSSPLLFPHYQQASQITYTSVFSPRSQYVLILPLPWKKYRNQYVHQWGWSRGLGCCGAISYIRLPFSYGWLLQLTFHSHHR